MSQELNPDQNGAFPRDAGIQQIRIGYSFPPAVWEEASNRLLQLEQILRPVLLNQKDREQAEADIKQLHQDISMARMAMNYVGNHCPENIRILPFEGLGSAKE